MSELLSFTGSPASAQRSKEPVLVVMHRRESQPGAVGQVLRAHGHALDIRRPRFGDPLPASLDGYAGAIVFGGPMSANDPDDYIRREIDWIGVPLSEGKPFLGICLGAQMLAKQLGAEVKPHPAGHLEAGWEPIHPHDQTLGPWPSHVYHWHFEGFSLCRDSVRLAAGDVFENQAFRHGRNAFGLQFHPEITLAMIHGWTVRGAAKLAHPGAQKAHRHVESHAIHGARLRAWTTHFMDAWLKSADRRDAVPEDLQRAA
ncbi:glutamine amidotransferase [Rhodomicrobium udaipurense JA643]|uniref:Glutamine amidotransferase n=1 Tax=Rhodomicrobium udaipurense TaxID=1202716 RepID=A0A8I1GAU4_9HYPH|nr:glutamine amidotransferase [Rhodomicrobium udaipurense]KAI93590.1 glutamine amidotransferase [Rhodomicrobium udaipurense JA643]MBJ7543678.1 glutamine amidotransferase [Rhodomicrobium udaipurense]